MYNHYLGWAVRINPERNIVDRITRSRLNAAASRSIEALLSAFRTTHALLQPTAPPLDLPTASPRPPLPFTVTSTVSLSLNVNITALVSYVGPDTNGATQNWRALESLRKSGTSRMRLFSIAQNYRVFPGFSALLRLCDTVLRSSKLLSGRNLRSDFCMRLRAMPKSRMRLVRLLRKLSIESAGINSTETSPETKLIKHVDLMVDEYTKMIKKQKGRQTGDSDGRRNPGRRQTSAYILSEPLNTLSPFMDNSVSSDGMLGKPQDKPSHSSSWRSYGQDTRLVQTCCAVFKEVFWDLPDVFPRDDEIILYNNAALTHGTSFRRIYPPVRTHNMSQASTVAGWGRQQGSTSAKIARPIRFEIVKRQ
ncbi:hypothetical protein DFH09DRAFT_1110434 [Mycena vulgaris]|nr:hypothetical protein DFH09DRAFT_1110434 [Mycena vulgaris]